MNSKLDIAIIGGGAAGLTAAVSAAQTAKALRKNVRITIIERNDRVGKKLLSTGNGRCNLSNADIDKKYYHSSSMDVLEEIIKDSEAAIAAFFASIGLHIMEENGRMYPYTQRASTVLDVLRMAAERLGVVTVANAPVKYEEFYALLNTSKVIVATGGLAAPSTGSKGDGMWFLSETGHKIEPTFPALTPLVCEHPAFPALKGIRLKPCRLTLNGVSHEGEVLFTENGISGIPAMQVSGAWKQPVNISIDLLPKMTEDETAVMLKQRADIGFKKEALYTGLFHKNLEQALLRDKADLKNWTMRVSNVRGYNSAQVTGGGVSLEHFNPKNMRSAFSENLFAAGEILDAYGDCGGYNLHWAWITGILAGRGVVNTFEEGF